MNPPIRFRPLLSLLIAFVLPVALPAQRRPAPGPIQREYQVIADRIIAAATADSAA